LEQRGSDRLGYETGRGRRVERGRSAAESLQQEDLPDAGVPTDEKSAHDGANHEVRRVRRQHHESPGKSVGDDAADQERGDLGQRPAGEGDSDVGRGSRQVEDGERDCDRGKVRAGKRDRSRARKQAEVALAERA
jgi:hypothetical protein